jgi:uncharacterized protein (DUF4415 family)
MSNLFKKHKPELWKQFQEVDRIFEEVAEAIDPPRIRAPIPALWRDVERAFPTHPPRRQLTLRLDEDVIAFFRRQGRGYQVRMNAVLRAYMLAAESGALKR